MKSTKQNAAPVPPAVWEVSYMTTHPTRPNLRTQVQATVQAYTQAEAINRGSFAIVRQGWNPPGEVVSAVRKFARAS
jgi:hypothetical protein